MRLSIPYTVPVQVIVDLDTGTVDRVVVIDESIAKDRSPDGFVEEFDGKGAYKTTDVDRAFEIAESKDWPRWEFGF